MGAERIDERGVRVGHEDHVRLLDLLEAPDRRAVEPEPFLERIGTQLVRRRGEVLHQSRQVTEPEVNDLDALVLRQCQDFIGCAFLHRLLLSDTDRRKLIGGPSRCRGGTSTDVCECPGVSLPTR